MTPTITPEALDLLSCPFCGNEAEFVPYKQDGLTLRCKSLGCVRRDQRTLRQSIEWLRQVMAADWNKRAALPELQAAPAAAGGPDAQPFAWTWVSHGGERHITMSEQRARGLMEDGSYVVHGITAQMLGTHPPAAQPQAAGVSAADVHLAAQMLTWGFGESGLTEQQQKEIEAHQRKLFAALGSAGAQPQAELQAAPAAAGVPIELSGIAETLKEGGGFWHTCSGCHESNEGYPTGPYSSILQCNLGNGCGECGGIGAIWDTTDYEAMGNYMAASMGASREPAAQPQAELQAAPAAAGVPDGLIPASPDIEYLRSVSHGPALPALLRGNIMSALRWIDTLQTRLANPQPAQPMEDWIKQWPGMPDDQLIKMRAAWGAGYHYGSSAIAARQPVGEPVVFVLYEQQHKLVLFSGAEETEGCWSWRERVDAQAAADRLHDSHGWARDYGYWIVTPLYTAPPAAVDLGQLPDGWRLQQHATCYQLSQGNNIIGNLVGPDAEANAATIAALIEGKAVRS